ncbi:MAG: SDR family oxidoreductase [Hyphomicrobiales bacterium]|nr:SDR family oxidoreductase [Hyphomicrobiales bacterium]
MTGRLQGKAAIVTGAGSGIGRASAMAFAREGARVLIADRAEDGLNHTLELIQKAGHAAEALAMDAGDEKDVVRLVDLAVKTFGRLDIVYANAGVSGGMTTLFEASVETFTEILRINLIGPFLAIQKAAPHMIRQGGGSIICTASVAGLRANAGNVQYAASKAGVISLVQTCSNALIGTGVRVNAICPGLIETGMTKPIFDLARSRGTDSKIGQLNPLQRAGRPEEIAAMALFLASDEASYVNGQAFPVDGGLSSTHPFAKPRK